MGLSGKVNGIARQLDDVILMHPTQATAPLRIRPGRRTHSVQARRVRSLNLIRSCTSLYNISAGIFMRSLQAVWQWSGPQNAELAHYIEAYTNVQVCVHTMAYNINANWVIAVQCYPEAIWGFRDLCFRPSMDRASLRAAEPGRSVRRDQRIQLCHQHDSG